MISLCFNYIIKMVKYKEDDTKIIEDFKECVT